MAYRVTKKSPALSKSKINDVIKYMSPSQRAYALAQNWECVPDGEWTDEQKLAFIIASVPMSGRYSAKFLASAFSGTAVVPPNPQDYPNSRPNLYRRLRASCPDALDTMIVRFRPHKHVPDEIKADDMWVGLTALANMIDDLRAVGYQKFRGYVPGLNGMAAPLSYTDPQVNAWLDGILSDDAALEQAVREFTSRM